MNQAVLGPTSLAADPAWRVALPTLVLTLLLILLLFRETALTMAGIWERSDTYAHGFIVPPITLWLIWRIRSSLAVLAPRYSFLAVFLVAGVGFAWLLGEVAAVNALSQFALVAMLILAVPAVLGWGVARRIAFPLLFLFFAVPFGDFTMPKLMEWTAHFTILGLRFSGIPVHAEGLRFVIPTGSWSVVEACSGVRYLIASVTVGTLFAYLTYRSLTRRLLFVLVSFLVPIIANWARAYMIVMIGHLSGNKLAVGVDHLIYGWLFFGIVILAMFWIGARWREDELEDQAQATALTAAPPVAAISRSLVAAVATVLVSGFWSFVQLQIEDNRAPQIGRTARVGPIAGWQASDPGFHGWQPSFENYAASSQASFEKDGQLVGVFLAYYRNQDEQHKLVSSTNVLVRSNDLRWAKVADGTRAIPFDEQEIKVRTVVLRGEAPLRMLVWQWYWVNGRWTASEVMAKAYLALSRLTGNGDDSALIVLYTPLDVGGAGEARLEDFARAAGPAINAALRQTLDGQ
ncbi:MAG: exosortase A [Candidatus Accumulibacter phosphatis]|mgnify:CR=1 FL=1|jgi:exosortase A|uniref:Exosortase A n=1 Tax=Candidatus Accumulibacter phosphatis TaxID=327160 RepID=A0A6A7RQ87_9PROT|nr:exosortase A [Candidatus Accumulibacter phosphatis]